MDVRVEWRLLGSGIRLKFKFKIIKSYSPSKQYRRPNVGRTPLAMMLLTYCRFVPLARHRSHRDGRTIVRMDPSHMEIRLYPWMETIVQI